MASFDQIAQKAGIQPVNQTATQHFADLAQNSGVTSATPPTEGKEGFWTSLAKGTAKPFVEAGATAMSGMEGLANLGAAGLNKIIPGGDKAAQYNIDQANKVTTEGYNVPGFGQVKPVGAYDTNKGLGENLAQGAKDIVGTGAEIAPWLMGGGAAEDIAGNVGKGAFGKALGGGLTEGAAMGGAGGFGSGLKEQGATTGSVLGSTLGGAAGGAVLGAAIPAVGALGHEIKNAVSPGATALLKSAIKPLGKAAQGFDKTLADALPALQEHIPQIKDLRTLDAAIKAKKADIWQQITQHIGTGADKGATLDGNEIADAMMNAAKGNSKMMRENPAMLDKLSAKADAYRGSISPVEAEDILEQTNAKLQSFYSKNRTGQALAQKADPEIAQEIQLASALREGLNKTLGNLPDEFQGLKNTYGALGRLGEHVQTRIPIAERQNMTSLAEQISAGRTAGNAALNLLGGRPMEALGSLGDLASTHVLKGLEMSDSKVNRAFRALEKAQKGKISVGDVLGKATGMAPSPKIGREEKAAPKVPKGEAPVAGAKTIEKPVSSDDGKKHWLLTAYDSK